MTTQTELTPLAQDEPSAGILNRLVYLLRGTYSGWLRLVGFDGHYYDAKGASLSSGNAVVYIQAAAGIKAIRVQKSAGPTDVFLVDDTGATIAAVVVTGAVAIGTNPASAGALRLASAGAVNARNAANNGDLALMASNGANQITVGDATNSPDAFLQASSGIHLKIAAADEVVVTSALVTITPDVVLTGAVWTAFSPAPTLTQAVSVTPTVNNARYRIFGKMAVVEIKLTAGGAGTATNPIEIGTIPAILAPKFVGAGNTHGTFMVVPASGAALRVGTAVFSSSTAIRCIIDNNTNYLGVTPALTLALNDIVSAMLVYELL